MSHVPTVKSKMLDAHLPNAFSPAPAHLSVPPADVAPPLQTALQADGTPRGEVLTLQTHPAGRVTDLRTAHLHLYTASI